MQGLVYLNLIARSIAWLSIINRRIIKFIIFLANILYLQKITNRSKLCKNRVKSLIIAINAKPKFFQLWLDNTMK